MKKLIFILGFLVVNYSVRAQWCWTYGEYFPPDEYVQLDYAADRNYFLRESPIYYSISFFEKEKAYEIAYFVNLSDDNMEGFCVSTGFFECDGNEIRLLDTTTGLEIRAYLENDFLRFIKGYELLKDKRFARWKDKLYANEDKRILTDYGVVEKVRDSLYVGNHPTIEPGVYHSFRSAQELHLADDGTFACGCKYDLVRDMKLHTLTVPILEGTWSQKGNLIILHDKHTDHDYYLICEEDGLRPMLLPGFWNLSVPCRDMDGILFKSL